MKKHLTLFILILMAVLTACDRAASLRATATPTPNVQATIDAAVLATATAQAAQLATIEAAVAATQTAIASTPVPTPSAPATATEDYVTMTEEELAVLIDAAVADAVAATEETAATTATATSDETLTAEEVQTIEITVAGAEEAIALAEAALTAYTEIYGELATETLVAIDELELLLAETTALVATANDILTDVDAKLEEGVTLSPETVQQLESAVNAAAEKAATMQQEAQRWQEQTRAAIEQRTQTMLSMEPQQVPGNRREALISAHDYLDAVRAALGDSKISQAELSAIAQAGANASAGLKAHGGAQLQGLGDTITGITESIARGQLPQVQGRVDELERALPERPSRP